MLHNKKEELAPKTQEPKATHIDPPPMLVQQAKQIDLSEIMVVPTGGALSKETVAQMTDYQKQLKSSLKQPALQKHVSRQFEVIVKSDKDLSNNYNNDDDDQAEIKEPNTAMPNMSPDLAHLHGHTEYSSPAMSLASRPQSKDTEAPSPLQPTKKITGFSGQPHVHIFEKRRPSIETDLST